MRTVRRGAILTVLVGMAFLLVACTAQHDRSSISTVGAGAVVTSSDVPHPAAALANSSGGGQRDTPTATAPSSPRTSPPVDRSASVTGVPAPAGGPRKVVVQVDPDGCNRAYGTAAQCIPLKAGGGKPVTCAYLTAEGFFNKPLQVHTDPLHLMKKPHVTIVMSGKTPTVLGCSDR